MKLFEKTHVSYSKLETFKKCPMRFYLRYIQGEKEVPSREVELGKLVHNIIAQYLVDIRGRDDLFYPNVKELSKYFSLVKPDYLDNCKNIHRFSLHDVAPFLTAFSKKMPRIAGKAVLEVEETKITRIGKWKMKSIIDLVLIRSNGEKSIIDFKTGKQSYVTRKQLKIYSLPIIGSPHYLHDNVLCNYVFLKDGTIKKFSVKKEDCQNIVNKLVKEIKSIESCDNFTKKPSPLCNWCGFGQKCNIKSGTYRRFHGNFHK